MKYVICGRSIEFTKYVENSCKRNKDENYIHAKTIKSMDAIKEEDTIVLLKGWWGRSWSKDKLKAIIKICPGINFEYLDGPFGESHREELFRSKSNSVNRFELMEWE